MSGTLGARLASAIAAKDEAALRAVLADDVDFKGLTPGRLWEGTGPDAVVEILFGSWFEPPDEIERVVDVSEREDVADTSHVGYRLDLTNPGGSYVAEQQAYYRGGDAIEHLRIMCSGFRPR
ncbi:hypothetical protein [Nocardioides sp. zg-1228]|uniref:hypothetical protein n=1 Tax=Nocardioides sp. zg-1228 TaxID=2763008 RepID=UPI001642364E|nr:hypothetical protein [Nocardioides sp. zg-1228]MBC2933689.1 hypothetical protein [Nocardioides sp. zg-1228]QSF58474.1 hypothetical protein JX575_04525 [Nocardioides sp. zg-1228]